MKEIEIRSPEEKEYKDFIKTMFLAAGRPVDDELIQEQMATMEMEHALAAFDSGKLVGTIGTRYLEMTMPGGRKIPFAAMGQGGVLPSHTRLGIMNRLMHETFDRVKEKEIPLTGWTTSAWPLYTKYGGGVATHAATYTFSGISQKAFAANFTMQEGGQTQFEDLEEAYSILPELHKKVCQYPGAVARDAAYWSRLLRRLEDGKSLDVLESVENLPAPMFCVNRNRDGEVKGCCVYRIHQKWRNDVYQSEMEIISMLATDDKVSNALWNFLYGSGMIRSIILPHGRIDEPLRWMLKDGRSMQQRAQGDHIWLRAMKPIEVLKNREFPKLTSEFRMAVNDESKIIDDIKIEITPNGQFALVNAIEGDVDVEMDIGTFSSLLLGGNSVHMFDAAGKFELRSEDALKKLSSAFPVEQHPYTDNSF